MRYPSDPNAGQQPYAHQPAQPVPQPYTDVQPAPTLQERYDEGGQHTAPVPRVQPGAPWPQPGQYTAPMSPQPGGYPGGTQPVQPVPGQYTAPMQPMQPMPGQYTAPMQPVQPAPGQYTAPMQPVPGQYTAPVPPVQQGYPDQSAAPSGDGSLALTPALRRAATRYFHDTGMTLGVLMAALIVIFIVVRLATRGYLWGLVFVLAAALVLEGHALQLLFQYVSDRMAGQARSRVIRLQGISTDAPSLLSRLGLSAQAQYILTDETGGTYRFVAEKNLLGSLGDLSGAEMEIAYLERSRLLAGLSPIRAGEFQTVLDSARERQLRQIFRDYLPMV